MDIDNLESHFQSLLQSITRCADVLEKRDVGCSVTPGFLYDQHSRELPLRGQSIEAILQDVEMKLLPGLICHQHRHFHVYYIQGNSMPSFVGDTLASAFAINCVHWNICPGGVELEALTMDWIAQMIGLPYEFLFRSNRGGGVIHSSSSECIFYTLLAARRCVLDELQSRCPLAQDSIHPSKLVAYASSVAHFSVKRACMLGMVTFHELETDENFAVRGNTLLEAIQSDRRKGLIPFWVCATLGTTLCCSFDNLEEIGRICDAEKLWLHVDAAYAGSAFVCPEYRPHLRGIKSASSFNFSANKLLQVHTDCSMLWVKDKANYTKTYNVETELFDPSKQDLQDTNFMYWGVPLSRRFRSLKLWFVLRYFGLEGLQRHVRKHAEMAQLMEMHVKNDNRFEVVHGATLGLICFKIKGDNELTQSLVRNLNATKKIWLQTVMLRDKRCIRFSIMHPNQKQEDVKFAFTLIANEASRILRSVSKRQ